MKSKSRLKARSRKLVVSKNCKKMQMTRVKGVKSKRVNRAHARTGTCSCTGSKRGYVTQQRRSWTREEGLVFVRCEDTRERRFSLLNVNVFVSRPLHPAKRFSLAYPRGLVPLPLTPQLSSISCRILKILRIFLINYRKIFPPLFLINISLN